MALCAGAGCGEQGCRGRSTRSPPSPPSAEDSPAHAPASLGESWHHGVNDRAQSKLTKPNVVGDPQAGQVFGGSSEIVPSAVEPSLSNIRFITCGITSPALLTSTSTPLFTTRSSVVDESLLLPGNKILLA